MFEMAILMKRYGTILTEKNNIKTLFGLMDGCPQKNCQKIGKIQ